MPLDASALSAELEALALDPGVTPADCAELWASAVASYLSTVAPVVPSVDVAREALAASLTAAFSSPAAAPGTESAFAAFAATLAAGMAPAFAGLPPPSPVGFAAQISSLPFPATPAVFADKFSSLIDTWARTGTATPAGGGPPIPWS